MANTNRPNGFRPVKHLTGAPYNGQFNIYEIVVGDGTATFVGDLVKTDAGTATDVYPTCIRAGTSGEVTSGLLLGAIVGFVPDPTNLNLPANRAASTKRYAYVADAPDLVFETMDGATVPTTATLIGMNTGFMATAGSAVTGKSGMTTGTTTATTTNTLPLKIVGIVNSVDNASGAASQRLWVMINQHALGAGTVGV